MHANAPQERVQAPALMLYLQHCPALLLQVGKNNRGKEETGRRWLEVQGKTVLKELVVSLA